MILVVSRLKINLFRKTETVLQFILVVAGVCEELFYRVAVPGALADVFVRWNDLVANAHGIAALTGILIPFVSFAQAFAAVITYGLTLLCGCISKRSYLCCGTSFDLRSGRQEMIKLFAGANFERASREIARG